MSWSVLQIYRKLDPRFPAALAGIYPWACNIDQPVPLFSVISIRVVISFPLVCVFVSSTSHILPDRLSLSMDNTEKQEEFSEM